MRKWILLQQRRPYHPYTVVSFAVFTALLRGLLEAVLFGRQWSEFLIFSYTAFYFHIAWSFILLLSLCGSLRWQRTVNVVVIGVFLGIFPPLVDISFSPAGQQSGLRYLYLLEFQMPPWFFYSPGQNFSLGEAVALWSAVILGGCYLYIQGLRLRIILWLVLSWAWLQFHIVILPSSVYSLALYKSQARELLYDSINVPYYLALAQLALTLPVYLFLNHHLLNRLIPRMLHALPFIMAALLGSRLVDAQILQTTAACLAVAFICLVLLVQNDYHDRNLDQGSKQLTGLNKGIYDRAKRYDVIFFNSLFIMSVAALIMVKSRLTLLLVVFFVCGILYHYPFYRVRNYLWGSMKIEGIWGLAAFCMGINAGYEKLPWPASLLWAALAVFGGFSLFSVIKDYKDVSFESRKGVNSFYTLFSSEDQRRRAHLYLSGMLTVLMFLPAVVLFSQGYTLRGLGVMLVAVLFPGLALHTASRYRGFKLFLLGISFYLLCLSVLLPPFLGRGG